MSHRMQSGALLIEILIALAIGIILTAGIIQIYAANKQTYRVADASARIQENARFASDVLARDIRMAGYQGCAGSARDTDNNLNDTSSFRFQFDAAAEGFEAISSSAWSPTLDGSISNPVGGSDVLTIRGVFGDEVAVTGSVDTSNCNTADLIIANASGFTANDIAIAGTCGTSAIFQITGLSAGSGEGSAEVSGYTVAHTATGSNPGNSDVNLGACFTVDGTLARLSTRSFYIRNNPNLVPSLYRTDISGPNVQTDEFVEGVENMQILYGVDTDGDDAANQFLRANDVTDWGQVASVRISLLFRSLMDHQTTDPQPYYFNGATQTPNDHRLRRVFTTTIGLRNRLP